MSRDITSYMYCYKDLIHRSSRYFSSLHATPIRPFLCVRANCTIYHNFISCLFTHLFSFFLTVRKVISQHLYINLLQARFRNLPNVSGRFPGRQLSTQILFHFSSRITKVSCTSLPSFLMSCLLLKAVSWLCLF